jgi:hypothetical protein
VTERGRKERRREKGVGVQGRQNEGKAMKGSTSFHGCLHEKAAW